MMRTYTLRLSLFVLVATFLWMDHPSQGALQRKTEKAAPRPKQVESISSIMSKHQQDLEKYLQTSMMKWVPEADPIRIASIASDIAEVALDPKEPRLFETRDETAVLLATVAKFEGHFWQYVEDGVCNDPSQAANPVLKNGRCDHGEAYSLWQIHPGRGVVLFDNGLWGWSLDGNGGLKGDDLLRDRKVAARTALHMLRSSLKARNNLCEYTGEHQMCPKADERLGFAKKWWKDHPVPQY